MLKCPICLEADDGTLIFAALKCGHVFHRDCISSWLTISENIKVCPMCRTFADSPLNLYFFSTPTKTNKNSISKKLMRGKSRLKRNKKKFSTHQQSKCRYELRSTGQISQTDTPYWFRIRRL